ncbi:MAG: hypothetical protein R6V23_12340, partial [Bacteroidales bacterium]
MNRLFITIIILFTYIITYSQPNKIKFGKVSKDELKMQKYQNDTSADAVILSDIGELYFQYNNYRNPKGFQYYFQRHLRIKIFNKNALNYGNHNIYLFHSGNNKEKLKSFNAYSFNIENGKISKDKIKKKDLLTEQFNKNKDVVKCIMPNVKEGTILDIYYEIESDYLYYLREWQFQYNIPVAWSEIKVTIPEFFDYKHFFKGYYDLTINNYNFYIDQVFKIDYVDKSANSSYGQRNSWELNSHSKIMHFAAENVPSFKNEPYNPSNENYIFKLFFELAQTKFPRSPVESYAKSWKSV